MATPNSNAFVKLQKMKEEELLTMAQKANVTIEKGVNKNKIINALISAGVTGEESESTAEGEILETAEMFAISVGGDQEKTDWIRAVRDAITENTEAKRSIRAVLRNKEGRLYHKNLAYVNMKVDTYEKVLGMISPVDDRQEAFLQRLKTEPEKYDKRLVLVHRGQNTDEIYDRENERPGAKSYVMLYAKREQKNLKEQSI